MPRLISILILLPILGTALGQTNAPPASTGTPPVPTHIPEADIGTVFTNTVGTLPANVRAASLAVGSVVTMADGATRTVGAPVRRDTLEIVPHKQPMVLISRNSKLTLGDPLPQVDKRPFYRTKVWNELTGGYIEYRAYNSGNTSFFQTELVIP